MITSMGKKSKQLLKQQSPKEIQNVGVSTHSYQTHTDERCTYMRYTK